MSLTASETSVVAVGHNPTNPTIPTPNSQLSDVQRQVLASIARGRTITAAAAEADIHRCTVHEWRKSNLPFRRALQRAQGEYRAQLKDYMKELSGAALETVRGFLQDPQISPAVRLRAALGILDRHDWRLPADAEPNIEKEIREQRLLEENPNYCHRP